MRKFMKKREYLTRLHRIVGINQGKGSIIQAKAGVVVVPKSILKNGNSVLLKNYSPCFECNISVLPSHLIFKGNRQVFSNALSHFYNIHIRNKLKITKYVPFGWTFSLV